MRGWLVDNPQSCPGVTPAGLAVSVTKDYGVYYPRDAAVATALQKICSQQ
ncbi:MAG: hypothetical protein ACR2HD_03575 [Solirubrobacteraceae bacterium]